MFKKRTTTHSAKQNLRRQQLDDSTPPGPEPAPQTTAQPATEQIVTAQQPGGRAMNDLCMRAESLGLDPDPADHAVASPAHDHNHAQHASVYATHDAEPAQLALSAEPALPPSRNSAAPEAAMHPTSTNVSPAFLSYFSHLSSSSSSSSTSDNPNSRFTVIDTPTKGRAIVSQTFHSPGSLLWTESPACALPTTEFTDTACTRCLATPKRVMRCRPCASASYCGIECQRADWPEHKLECAHLRAAKDAKHEYPPVIRMFARLLKMMEAGVVVQAGEEKVPVWELVEQLQGLDLDMEEAQQMGQGVMMARNLVSNGQFMPPVLAMKFLGQLNNNGITILPHSTSIDPVGLGLYPLTSLINHSCTPNAVAFFHPSHPRQLHLRCLQPISPGNEITINYVDVCQPEPARRADLAKYHFTCTCALCERERGAADRMAVKGKNKPKVTSVLEAMSLGEYTRAMRYGSVDSRLLQATRRALIDQLLNSSVPVGKEPDYASIVRIAADLVDCYAEHIGRGHPTTLVHEMQVLKTKAYLLQGDVAPKVSLEQVREDLERARRVRSEWEVWYARMKVWFTSEEMRKVFSEAEEARAGVEAYVKAIEGLLRQPMMRR
ncbi:hypothetical protein BCR44DRAFT_50545 [Catenaria anguillulae PL171]|uniref:SET domain-containing protein n=1 Tax=Catenaria anguillulae PL171 TaxID=765915 RepID=A0A1Y2HRD5_9FUNG|nr:hypothetical protein BCR44DRAFT_50545 [Catenaria anguillulae PL171]